MMEPQDVVAAGPRPATLRHINQRRFLEEIRRSGPRTRAELTRSTGVAPPTASGIIADLLEQGWIEPTERLDDPASSKGRPGQYFRLATSNVGVIGATIGIDSCCVTSASIDGEPFPGGPEIRFSTPRDYRSLINALAAAVQKLIAARSLRWLGIGIGVPGLVDEAVGMVELSPNLPFLNGQSIGPDLALATRLDVVCTQEEHALCLAEAHRGGASDHAHFAVVDVTAGMGMGVVTEGHYVSGRRGFAGEIGHTTVEPNGPLCGCGNHGCLETVATDVAFDARLARGETPEEALLAVRGYLAIGLATVVNLFNPEAVFVHSSLFDRYPGHFEALVDATAKRALAPAFRCVHIHRTSADRMDGVLAGLLEQIFAAVGPRLS